jgi:hypothetical protein
MGRRARPDIKKIYSKIQGKKTLAKDKIQGKYLIAGIIPPKVCYIGH